MSIKSAKERKDEYRNPCARLTRPALIKTATAGGDYTVRPAAADLTIGRVMPIDPVLAIVGPDADQSTYQQVYQQLGFDKSLTTQFGIYFVNLLHGDLGNALLTGKPVVDDIIRVSPPPWSWQRWRLLSARVLVFRWRVGGGAAQ